MWREAISLVRTAATDTNTYLGAKLAGFTYPARTIELVHAVELIALDAVNRKKPEAYFDKAIKRLLPFTDTNRQRGEAVADDERDDATRKMLADYGIDPTLAGLT